MTTFDSMVGLFCITILGIKKKIESGNPAYQSALLLTPLFIIRIFASLLGFWSWLRTFLTLSIILLELYMAYAHPHFFRLP